MSAELQAFALTTLDEAKDRCRIEQSDRDHQLKGLINGASALVNRHTMRKLKSATYTSETYDGNGEAWLYLKEYPITSVTALAVHDGVSTWTFTPADDLKIMNEGRKVEIYYYSTSAIPATFLRGQQNVTVTYIAGYLAGTHDIELAVLEDVVIDLVKRKYDQFQEGLVGVHTVSYEGGSISYSLDDLLPSHKSALSTFVRVVV